MPLPFAINGLGRIGRALLRIARERPGLQLVAVNDLAPAEQLAPLISRDTLHGPFAGEVAAEPGALLLDGRRIPVTQQAELERITWGDATPRIVVDATGQATRRPLAEAHLHGPVERVIVSANAAGMDLTVCIGVNDGDYDPARHRLLSAASCTTNALVPLLAVLEAELGLERALFNTVHSYNNDQRLLSFPHPDSRRAREAALNMIPTTTSAVEAAVRILPRLEGRLDGYAVRVPTANVSLVDLVAELGEPASLERVQEAFARAAAEGLAGIVKVTREPVVSSDLMSESASAVVDLPLTQASGTLARVVAWYDNEWGHASRLADLLELVDRRQEGA